MTRLRVAAWAAWSPGRETHEEWRQWCAAPDALAVEGAPEVKFLPPAVRRRCTRLSKMMLRAAFDCCGESLRAGVRTVFASRHGSIHVAVQILEHIVRREPVSPMQFSHSVHNAQAGLFSIAASNREASSSLAGEEDTFPSALIEALLLLERSPDQPVLIVVGDEPIPETLHHLIEEPDAAYALALLVDRADAGPSDREGASAFELELADEAPPEAASEAPPRAWPQALEFLRWLESADPQAPELRIGAKRCYRFRREG